MEPTSIPRDDIERAVGVIAGRLRRTPTLSCEDLGPRHFLKAELLQRTGSFKPRGMLTKLASLTDEEKARGIVTWSAGNAAQGAAFAAAENGVECKVFMWATANPLKVAATRALGAEVDLGATGPADAHERLLEYMEQSGRTFVHPFDDPVLQAGHGTLGLEIVEDVPDVATIVVPVGGGGLIAGVASAVDCTVVGVEPEGAPTLSAALSGGSPVRIEPSSIADGLNAPFTGSGTLAVCRDRVDHLVLVTDDEIAEGMRFLYTRAKLACEPAGAAAVAALLAGKIVVEPGSSVVAVVSGGNADPQIAAGILAGR
ncbi:MAG: pyridoxal-phosphate dependent enzyme [Thermoleophilia bacterium]|nr:pyridoxal-phosphate dependent enzyme [Thermoleophilia bacterium]MDH5280321.1 pyridoxal-phosphate dependent enzyme [Thermoleophilia bacterium]